MNNPIFISFHTSVLVHVILLFASMPLNHLEKFNNSTEQFEYKQTLTDFECLTMDETTLR